MLSARKGAETLGLEARNSLSRSLWLSYPWWPSEVCPWLLWVSFSSCSDYIVISLPFLSLRCYIYCYSEKAPFSLARIPSSPFWNTQTHVFALLGLSLYNDFSGKESFAPIHHSKCLQGTWNQYGTWVKSRLTRFTSVDICFIKQEKGLGNGSAGKVSVLQTWGVELEAQNTHKSARFDDIHLSFQC